MERPAIEDLFDYTDYAWDRLAKVMEKLPVDIFVKPIEGSGWPSLQHAFLHIVGAYDYLLNDLLGLGPRLEAREELQSRISKWEALAHYRVAGRAAFRQALDVPDEQLFAKKTYDFDFGPAELSRADILANLLVHEIGHRGDISTLFHQLGVKHLLLDYLLYVARPDDFLADEVD